MIPWWIAFGFILAASAASYMAGRYGGRYDALYESRQTVREVVTVCELASDQGTAPRSRC